MAQHPPWLRFSAYVVGLPKTGSTSVATIFGNYRTGHEWKLPELAEAGLARQAGELTDDEFIAAVGPRLASPTLELDSATSHHLYADLLRERFPRAVFIHTVRDVRSWIASLLDMELRQRLGRAQTGLAESHWERRVFAAMTEETYDSGTEIVADDRASLPALMRYWAVHMRTMADVLPGERSLRVPTANLSAAEQQLAALVGVPPDTLRFDLSHANRAAVRLDRFAVFDSPEVREVYHQHCADIMAQVFPQVHSRMFTTPLDDSAAARQTAQTAWDEHVVNMRTWVADAVEKHAPEHLRPDGTNVGDGVTPGNSRGGFIHPNETASDLL